MSLANISIVGNLARDPEQHEFANGHKKTTLTIAVNSFNKIRKEKITDFYRVETWDRLGELAKSYLHKGNQVTVSGRLALEKWTDRDGKSRITPTVQATQLAFPQRLKPYPDTSSNSAVQAAAAALSAAPPVEPPPELYSEPHLDSDFDIEDASRHESDVEPPEEEGGEIVRIPYDDPHHQKTA